MTNINFYMFPFSQIYIFKKSIKSIVATMSQLIIINTDS